MGSNFGSSKSPASAIAASNSNGLEMLPIGSVGIVSNVYQSPDCFWTSPRSFSQPPAYGEIRLRYQTELTEPIAKMIMERSVDCSISNRDNLTSCTVTDAKSRSR